jgi:hypothetical protein
MRVVLLVVLLSAAIFAKRPIVDPNPNQALLRLTHETAPPGGIAQLKLELTEPKPIIRTRAFLDVFDLGVFESFEGIAADQSNGPVGCAVLLVGKGAALECTSSNGQWGLNADYPIMTFAVRVAPDAVPGASVPVSLDSIAPSMLNALGLPYEVEVKNGSLTAGPTGSLSIDNILPGGGRVEPKTPFRIVGGGFAPGTRVQIEGLDKGDVSILGLDTIEITPQTALVLDGMRIRLRTPTDEQQEYFSYMRGVEKTPSADAVLSRVIPVFPSENCTVCTLVLPAGAVDSYLGVAMQNQNRDPAAVEWEVVDGAGGLIGGGTGTLDPGEKVIRSLAELVGPAKTVPLDAVLRTKSPAGVQALGLEIKLTADGPEARPVLPVSGNPAN